MNLAKARREKGLSQEQLAAKANISQSSVASYENGTRKPSPVTARRVASVLGLTIEEMWSMFYEDVDGESRCG